MRKRSITMLLDKLFYFLILLLPLFMLLFASCYNYKGYGVYLYEFYENLGFACSTLVDFGIDFDGNTGFLSDMFYSLLNSMFGIDSYFLSCYMQYVVVITLIHLLVDLILLLPRVCKKLISKIGGDDVG